MSQRNSQEHLIGTKVSMDNKNDETLEVHEDSAVKNQNHKCEYCFKTFAGDTWYFIAKWVK